MWVCSHVAQCHRVSQHRHQVRQWVVSRVTCVVTGHHVDVVSAVSHQSQRGHCHHPSNQDLA